MTGRGLATPEMGAIVFGMKMDAMHMGAISRRTLLLAAGAAALGFAGRPAHARPADVDYEMNQVLRGATAAPGRVRLDLPRHSDAGTSVPMTLSVDGPLTADEFPEAVHVYGTENPRPRIMTAYFTPACGEATVTTRIRLDGAQEVRALLRMNDGSFHSTSAPVSVTFGACANVGSGPAMDDSFEPVIRVSMPDTAARGELLRIRTLISHPMESGFRLDNNNLFVPLRIIERFVCRVNGKEAVRFRLEPAIATNPYLEFRLLAQETADIEFEWLDTNGRLWRESRHVAVG